MCVESTGPQCMALARQKPSILGGLRIAAVARGATGAGRCCGGRLSSGVGEGRTSRSPDSRGHGLAPPGPAPRMAAPMTRRPPFIVSSADVAERIHRYPNSTEDMAPSRPIGRTAGLLRIGIHLVRVPPGARTS